MQKFLFTCISILNSGFNEFTLGLFLNLSLNLSAIASFAFSEVNFELLKTSKNRDDRAKIENSNIMLLKNRILEI